MRNEELKYVQIYNILKEELYNSKYEVGGHFPTEDQLKERFGVSKTTIRHTIAMLVADQLISVRQGSGMIVLPIQHRQISYNKMQGAILTSIEFTGEYAGHEVMTSRVSVDTVKALEATAAALQLPEGTEVYRLQFFNLVKSDTVALYTNYIPLELAPGLENREREIVRVIPFLKEEYHREVSYSLTDYTFSTANIVEAKLLGTECGSPLLEIHTTYYMEGDIPMMYVWSRNRADIMKINFRNDSQEFIF
ncbi:MAG: GntR family transcriptional regulator [Lachnospiraceae bacterium]|nr:GntR family transcriptional regulator [Lachnospiraceae bacterium]